MSVVKEEIAQLKLMQAQKEIERLSIKVEILTEFKTLDEIVRKARADFRSLLDIFRAHPDCKAQEKQSLIDLKNDLLDRVAKLTQNWR